MVYLQNLNSAGRVVTTLKRAAWACVLCLLMHTLSPSHADAAGLPDVVLSSVQGEMVDVSTAKGEILTGVLKAFDDEAAILLLGDGSIIAISREDLLAVRFSSGQTPSPQVQTVTPPIQEATSATRVVKERASAEAAKERASAEAALESSESAGSLVLTTPAPPRPSPSLRPKTQGTLGFFLVFGGGAVLGVAGIAAAVAGSTCDAGTCSLGDVEVLNSAPVGIILGASVLGVGIPVLVDAEQKMKRRQGLAPLRKLNSSPQTSSRLIVGTRNGGPYFALEGRF
jgi:hypothetical protein